MAAHHRVITMRADLLTRPDALARTDEADRLARPACLGRGVEPELARARRYGRPCPSLFSISIGNSASAQRLPGGGAAQARDTDILC